MLYTWEKADKTYGKEYNGFTCHITPAQTRGRTKSLFSTMKKLLRLDDLARGGRGRGEVFDLLGLRVVVSPNEGIAPEEGEAMAAQASQLYLRPVC